MLKGFFFLFFIVDSNRIGGIRDWNFLDVVIYKNILIRSYRRKLI